MFTRILCPLDGSEHAERALELAIDLAKRHGASLLLLHALLRHADSAGLRRFAEIEGLAKHLDPEIARMREREERFQIHLPVPYEDTAVSSQALVEIGRHILDDAKASATDKDVASVETILVDGDPADRILRCVDERKVDCVVIGSRGLSDVKGLFLGSVSHKVTSRAPCTCIVVK